MDQAVYILNRSNLWSRLMRNKVIDDVLKAIKNFDTVFSNPLGICYLQGASIRIDTSVDNIEMQDSLFEHELTHRSDILTTHFGNIYNLLADASQKASYFPPEQHNKIVEMFEILVSNQGRTSLEGHAIYNQRYVLRSISEDLWLSRLKLIGDHYCRGYELAKGIMQHFTIIDAATLHFSDVMLKLPLQVNWYKDFSTIDSAHECLKRSDDHDFPDARLARLEKCIAKISVNHPQVINSITSDINNSFTKVVQSAMHETVNEDTAIQDDIHISSSAHPTGRRAFSFIYETLVKHLHCPLGDLGFDFATVEISQEINAIVDSWNNQSTKKGMSGPLTNLKMHTTESSKNLNISFGPIERHRAVYKMPDATLVPDITSEFLTYDPRSLIIVRQHHVTSQSGWDFASEYNLPLGSWYVLFGLCIYDELGKYIHYHHSPSWSGYMQFYQLYCTFNDCNDMMTSLPPSIPSAIWLLPDLYYSEYDKMNDLKRQLEQVTDSHMLRNNEWYTILSQNDLGSILKRLKKEHDITDLLYDDFELWRVWIVKASQNFVFLSSRIRSLDVIFEERLTRMLGVAARKRKTVTLQYLGQWLGSGEGF